MSAPLNRDGERARGTLDEYEMFDWAERRANESIVGRIGARLWRTDGLPRRLRVWGMGLHNARYRTALTYIQAHEAIRPHIEAGQRLYDPATFDVDGAPFPPHDLTVDCWCHPTIEFVPPSSKEAP